MWFLVLIAGPGSPQVPMAIPSLMFVHDAHDMASFHINALEA